MSLPVSARWTASRCAASWSITEASGVNGVTIAVPTAPKGRAGRVSVIIMVSSRGCSGSRGDAAVALDSGVGHGHRLVAGVLHLLGIHIDRSPAWQSVVED